MSRYARDACAPSAVEQSVDDCRRRDVNLIQNQVPFSLTGYSQATRLEMTVHESISMSGQTDLV